jgi:hypothetical protein
MTASTLRTALEKHGLTCDVEARQLSIRPRARWEELPEHARRVAVAFRQELLVFLTTGHDGELDPLKANLELTKLGFILIEFPDSTGAIVRRWSHVRGDEYGDQVLLGLIAPTDADEEKFYSKNAQVRV